VRPSIPGREPDLTIEVFGDPKTKGSTKSFVPQCSDGTPVRRPDGRLMVVTKNDAGEPAEAWAGIVAAAAGEAVSAAGFAPIAVGGIAVSVDFFLSRSKSHYGTGRNAGQLKESAAPYPVGSKFDVDKLLRAVLDPLKGVVWHDDGQVVVALPLKRYADGRSTGAVIRVWRLPATVGEILESRRMVLVGNDVLTGQSG
jgi:endodeoxyribonuclease RusA